MQESLKHFYIYRKRKPLKLVLYIYPKKLLLMVASQKKSVILYLWSGSIFLYFMIFFLYSISICLLFSGIFLYRSQPYSHFLFFILQKNLDTFHKLFLSLFLIMPNESLDILLYDWRFLYKKLMLKNWSPPWYIFIFNFSIISFLVVIMLLSSFS